MEPGSSREVQIIKQDFQNNASNKESARFLKRVLQKVEHEQLTEGSSAQERAYNFTGLNVKVFPVLAKDYQVKDVEEMERSLIQEHLIAFYLRSSLGVPDLPTTRALFESLYDKIPPYVDIRTFRKYLANMGYVWVKVYCGYVVMERPEVTFERYYYLKDITKHRDDKRPVFFVDETVLSSNRNYYSLKKYNSLTKAASKAGIVISQNGLVKSIYAVSKTGVYALNQSHEFTTEKYENWMLNELLPVLPQRSVVVIKPAEHNNNRIEKPTLYSCKTDMIDWLEMNNVPFDENVSKCELVDLIDTYTSDSDGIDKIENILKLNGHTLLRLPVYIEKMTTAHYVFQLVKLNANKVLDGDVLGRILQSITPEMLENYEKNVSQDERDTLDVDMKMDNILDTVMAAFQKMRKTDANDSEVPLSDSD